MMTPEERRQFLAARIAKLNAQRGVQPSIQMPGLTPGRPVSGGMDVFARIFDAFGQPARRAFVTAYSGGTPGEIGKAALKGLKFGEYYSGEQALKEMGVEDPGIAKSLVFEIGTDPLSWIPAAWITKPIGKGAKGVQAVTVAGLSRSAKGQKLLAAGRTAAELAETSVRAPLRRVFSKYPVPLRKSTVRAYKSFDDLFGDESVKRATDMLSSLLQQHKLGDDLLDYAVNTPNPSAAKLTELIDALPSRVSAKHRDRIQGLAGFLAVKRDPELAKLMRSGQVERAIAGTARTYLDELQFKILETEQVRQGLYQWADNVGLGTPEKLTEVYHLLEMPKGLYQTAIASTKYSPEQREFIKGFRWFYDEHIPKVFEQSGIPLKRLGGDVVEDIRRIERTLARERGKAMARLAPKQKELVRMEKEYTRLTQVAQTEGIRGLRAEVRRLEAQASVHARARDSLDMLGKGLVSVRHAGVSKNQVQAFIDRLPQAVSKKELRKRAVELRRQAIDALDSLPPEQEALRKFIQKGGRFTSQQKVPGTTTHMQVDLGGEHLVNLVKHYVHKKPTGKNWYKPLDVAAAEFGYENLDRVQRGTASSVEAMLTDLRSLHDRGAFVKNPARFHPMSRYMDEAVDELMTAPEEYVIEGMEGYQTVKSVRDRLACLADKVSKGEQIKVVRKDLAKARAYHSRRLTQIGKQLNERRGFLAAAQRDPFWAEGLIQPGFRQVLAGKASAIERRKASIAKQIARVNVRTDPLTNPRIKQLQDFLEDHVQYVRRLLTPEAQVALRKNTKFNKWLQKERLKMRQAGGGPAADWSTFLSEHIHRKFSGDISVAEINAMILDGSDGVNRFVDMLGSDGMIRHEHFAEWLMKRVKKKGEPGLFLTDPILSHAAYMEDVNRVGVSKWFLDAQKQFGVPVDLRDFYVQELGFTDLAHWATTNYKELEGWMFPPDLVKYINHHAQSLAGDDIPQQLARTWLKFRRGWMAAVLARPGFHIRNAVENVFKNTVLAGLRDVRIYDYAFDVQRRVDPSAFKLMQKGGVTRAKPLGSLLDSVLKRPRLPESKLLGVSKTGERITISKIVEELRTSAKGVVGFHGFAGVEAQMLSRPGQKPGVLSSIAEWNRSFGALVENNARTALYIHERLKGKTAKLAREIVGEIHFDYDMLTPAQRQIKRYLIPFFTWRQKNLGLQLRMMHEKSRTYNALVKAIRAGERQQEPGAELTPDWVRENVGIQVWEHPDGNKEYFLLGNWLGVADVMQLARSLNIKIDERRGLPWSAIAAAPWHDESVMRKAGIDLVVESHPAARGVMALAGYDPWRREMIEDPAMTEFGGDYDMFLGMPMRRQTIAFLKMLPQINFLGRQVEQARRAVAGVPQKGHVTLPKLAGEWALWGPVTQEVDRARQMKYQQWKDRELRGRLKTRIRNAYREGNTAMMRKYQKQLEATYR